MVKRRGRPKKIDTKYNPIRIRLTKEQAYWLRVIMDKTGKNKTDAVAYALQIVFNLLK